jgi:hypothetical protein
LLSFRIHFFNPRKIPDMPQSSPKKKDKRKKEVGGNNVKEQMSTQFHILEATKASRLQSGKIFFFMLLHN